MRHNERDEPNVFEPAFALTDFMNITKRQFRWVVTASIVATILGIVASFVGEPSLPAPLRDYLQAESEAEPTAREMGLARAFILFLSASVVSTIGLYRFWRFARPLTVIVWIGGVIISIAAGPTVCTGLTTALYEVAAVLNGIILALIYMTPAQAWFEKPQEKDVELGS